MSERVDASENFRNTGPVRAFRCGALVVCGIAAGSCESATPGVAPGFPGAQAALVYLPSEDLGVAYGHALDDRGEFSVQVVVPGSVQLTRVEYFSQDLKTLGLAEGINQLFASGDCTRLGLPEPLHRLAIAGEGGGAPGPELEDFRLRVPRGVVSEPIVHEFDSFGKGVLPLTRRSGEVFLPVDNALLELSPKDPNAAPTVHTPRLEIPFSTAAIRSYYQHPTGLEFIGTSSSPGHGRVGQLWCGRFETGFAEISRVRTSSPSHIVEIVGPDSETEPFELFVVSAGCDARDATEFSRCPRGSSQQGQFFRLSAHSVSCEVTVELLTDPDAPVAGSMAVRSLLFRLGNGQAIATLGEGKDILRYDQGVLTRTQTPNGVTGGVILRDQLVLLSRATFAVGVDAFDPRTLEFQWHDRIEGGMTDQLEAAHLTNANSVVYFGRDGAFREVSIPGGRPLGPVAVCSDRQRALRGNSVSALVGTSFGLIMTTSYSVVEPSPERKVQVMILPGPTLDDP